MRTVVKPLCLAGIAALLGSCSDRVERMDPSRDVLLDEYWNDTDRDAVAQDMLQSLLAHDLVTKSPQKPAVAVGRIVNRTDEHLDIKALGDRIVTAMVRSGKLDVVDVTARDEVSQEYEYQASGNVDPQKRTGPGKQLGVKYFLRGNVTKETHEKDGTKVVSYLVTLTVTNVETTRTEWQHDHPIKKVKASSSVRF